MPELDRCKQCKTYQPVSTIGKQGVCASCMRDALEEPEVPVPVIPTGEDTITFIKEGEDNRVFASKEAAAEGMRCKVETVVEAIADGTAIRGFVVKKVA